MFLNIYGWALFKSYGLLRVPHGAPIVVNYPEVCFIEILSTVEFYCANSSSNPWRRVCWSGGWNLFYPFTEAGGPQRQVMIHGDIVEIWSDPIHVCSGSMFGICTWATGSWPIAFHALHWNQPGRNKCTIEVLKNGWFWLRGFNYVFVFNHILGMVQMMGLQAKLGRPGQLLGSGCMGRGGRGMVSPGPVSAVYMNSLHESAAMKLLGTWILPSGSLW
jgi:hypothetical protein